MLHVLLRHSHRVVATWYAHEPERALPGCVFHQLDASKAAAVEELVDRVERESGEIEACVYAAAQAADGIVPLLSPADWTRTVEVNLWGALHTCRAAGSRMAARGRGRIVVFGSAKAETGAVGQAAYAATKGGAMGIAKALARELAPFGVAVNIVCPGYVPSRLNRFDPRRAEAEHAAALLGIEHSARDAAEFVAFLCDGHLRGVTGQVFQLHGRVFE